MNRLGLALLIICLLDLTGTALGIHLGYLGEANPMLQYIFSLSGTCLGSFCPNFFCGRSDFGS